jgi:hypothetical protein
MAFFVSFMVLGALFGVLSVVCLVQVVRFYRVRDAPFFMIQKMYAATLLVASAVRTVFFVLAPVTRLGRAFFERERTFRREDPLFAVMADAAELLYFVAFAMLGLFWAEVAYNAAQRREAYERRVKRVFFACLVCLWLAQAALWVALFALPVSAFDAVMVADNVLFIGVYTATALFTVYYGALVHARVRRNPIRSAGRTKKLREVVVVTLACLLFLLVHVITSFVNLLPSGPDLHHTNYIALAAIAIFCELLPACMLLYVLRHRPQPSQQSQGQGQSLLSGGGSGSTSSSGGTSPMNSTPSLSYNRLYGSTTVLAAGGYSSPRKV